MYLLEAQAYVSKYEKAYASPCGHSRLKALCYNNTAYNSTASNNTALAPPLTKVSALSNNTSYFAAIDCL